MNRMVSKYVKLATTFVMVILFYLTISKNQKETAVNRDYESNNLIKRLKDENNPDKHKRNDTVFYKVENINLVFDEVKNIKTYTKDSLSHNHLDNGMKTYQNKVIEKKLSITPNSYKRHSSINNVDLGTRPIQNFKNKSLHDVPSNKRVLFNQQKSETNTVLDEKRTDLRCESKHFGCFELTPVPKRFNRIEIDLGKKINKNNCIEYCSKRNTNYAGLHHTTCYCGNDVRQFISIKNAYECSTTCIGNPKDTCGGEKSVDLYYIMSHCSKEPISFQNNLLGCFEGSKDFTEILDENWVHSYKKTTLSCFTYCENNSFPISGFNFFNDCICGRFSKKFNLDQKISNTNCSTFIKENKLHSKLNMFTLYKTSAEDERCSEMKYKYVRGPHVLLTSVPSSGNTWLRYLLEKASGFFTGSVYKDKPVFEKGYLGEMTDQTVIVKDHFYDQKFNLYNAAIFIVRDPYKTMLAEFKRQKTASHVGVVDSETIKKDFQLYDEGTLLFLSRSLTSKNIPLYVVVYENLVKDPIGEVRKLLTNFPPLKLIVPDEEVLENRLLCLSSQLSGFFKRKKQSLDFDPYSNEVKKTVNENISKARKILSNAGFEIPNYEKPVS